MKNRAYLHIKSGGEGVLPRLWLSWAQSSEGGQLRGKGVPFLSPIAWPQIPTLTLSVNLLGNLFAVSLNLSILNHKKGIVVSSEKTLQHLVYEAINTVTST